MPRRAALAAVLLAFPVLAAQKGYLGQAADLRARPSGDAEILRSLPQGLPVEVLVREGGWYRLQADGAEGWARMSAVRFSRQAGGGAEVRDSVAMIESGRAGATQGTSTTGVRGLSEEDLASAQPDTAAVASLEQLAVAPDEARRFAGEGSLQARKDAP